VAEFPARPYVVVRVATLDDNPGAAPSAHIWTSHAVPWLIDAENAQAYPEWYPGH
jgi:hypothetical protein